MWRPATLNLSRSSRRPLACPSRGSASQLDALKQLPLGPGVASASPQQSPLQQAQPSLPRRSERVCSGEPWIWTAHCSSAGWICIEKWSVPGAGSTRASLLMCQSHACQHRPARIGALASEARDGLSEPFARLAADKAAKLAQKKRKGMLW